MSNPYNLDDGVTEYFQFQVKGHLYNFRYPSTGEMKEMGEVTEDNEQVKKFLAKLITKVDEKSPDFEEIVEQMTVPHWTRFRDMISKEMGTNGQNSSSKTTQETT